MEEQHKSNKKPGRLPTHIFGNLTWCHCGNKMYTRADASKYFCRKCNHKIPAADLEEIVREELKGFFANPERLDGQLSEAKRHLAEKEAALVAHERAIAKVRDEMNQTPRLYLEGQVTSQGFGQFYKPAEERLNQLLSLHPLLQAEVAHLKVSDISADEVLSEARTLYDRWPSLTAYEKRKIAESIVEKIVIGEGTIDLTLGYLPTSEELCKSQQQVGLG